MAAEKSRTPQTPFHGEFAAQVLEDLQKGAAPWQWPWRPSGLHVLNPVTGTVYVGLDLVMPAHSG